jgi:hypothetical protein
LRAGYRMDGKEEAGMKGLFSFEKLQGKERR